MHALAARLTLEHLSYALYTPTDHPPCDAIEHARANVLSDAPLLDATLASPCLADPALYLFRIGHPLPTFDFPGLTLAQSGSHSPSSLQAHPLLLSHFYNAVRAHLIAHIVAAADAAPTSRRLRRFKHGFLISQAAAAASDWEYKSISRPLVFCQLQILLHADTLLVHPLLIPTPFLDIGVCLPLPQGTPITLLPYGTPAYFLATYNGPTAGLVKQFHAALAGLGPGHWDATPTNTPTFLIACIRVENRQGEDKAITVIYPTKLCLATVPGATTRPPLQHIPELPPPLQPSPHVAPTMPSASGIAYQSLTGGMSGATTPVTEHPHPRRPSIFSSPTSESLHAFRALNLSRTNDLRHVAVEVGGYVDAVARERERERERMRREREGGAGAGVGSSPKMSRASTTMSVPAPVTAEAGPSSLHRLQPPNVMPGPSIGHGVMSSPFGMHHHYQQQQQQQQQQNTPPPLMPAPQMQTTPSQTFYPSPPQTVPAHHGVSMAGALTSPVVENPPASAVSEAPPQHLPATASAAQQEQHPSAPSQQPSQHPQSQQSQPQQPSTQHQQQPQQQRQSDPLSPTFDSYVIDQSVWAAAAAADAEAMEMGMGMGMGEGMGMDFMGMDMGMGSMGMSDFDMDGMGGMNLDGMDMGMGSMGMGGMGGMGMGGIGSMGGGIGMGGGMDSFAMNMDMMDMNFGMPPTASTTGASTAGGRASNTTTVPAATAATATTTTQGGNANKEARTEGGGGGRTTDFDDFTDDDFNFFDRPAAAPPPPAPPSAPAQVQTQAHAHPFGGAASPSPAHQHQHHGAQDVGASTNNGQIWTPGAFLDGFAPTPDAHAHHHQQHQHQHQHQHQQQHQHGAGDALPPDLMPSSPGSTPAGSHVHSAPATPAAGVHLAYEPGFLGKKADSAHLAHAGAITSAGAGAGPAPAPTPTLTRFEPIPFASYHRRADGKYFAGKFAALPSPPPDSPVHLSTSADASVGSGSGSVPPPPVSAVTSSSVGTTTTTASSSGSGSGGGVGYFYHLPPPSTSASTSTSSSFGGGARMAFSSSLPTSPGVAGNGWRLRYNAQTDPRIGVISKLIGVKRKTPASVLHGTREPPKVAPWAGSCVPREEWEMPQERREKEDEDDEEDEDEEDEVLEEVDGEEDDDDPATPLRSRPTTPPPSYLPLGPTLLYTQFQHAHLLPLSVPLRPPGAAVAPVNLAAGASAHGAAAVASVPTPVSPAATMGAATERSKSLETAAAVVAAEVVENPVWAETWRASTVGAKTASSVWSADYKAVAQLLKSVPGLEAPLTIEELFDLDDESEALEPLEAPMISIGKGDAVIQVLPTALRFWEKLGLDPKGGKKDFSAFVLYEDGGGEQRQVLVETWLANLGNVYRSKHLGDVSLGKSSSCSKDGLLPIRFDVTLRKTLDSFIASLTPPQPTIVIFLVLPLAAMSLSSPVLRQVLVVTSKIFNRHHSSVLSLQFVPEQHLFNALERSPTSFGCSLEQLCLAVYNRLPVPVDRVRTIATNNPEEVSDIRAYLPAPSFTLSRPIHSKVSFVRTAHPSLDVLDRYTLLHIGYHLTSCGRWIIACGIDQRGEMHEVGVWLTREAGQGDHEGDPEMNDDEYAVKKVWDFGMQLARKADVEWRVVFTRLGVMNEKELHAWSTCLDVNVASSRSQPPMHHTVCCVVPDAPWLLLSKPSPSINTISSPTHASQPTRSLSTPTKPSSLFVDASTSTYAIFPRNTIPISIPASQSDLGLSQSFVAEPPALPSMPSSPHPDSFNSLPVTPSPHLDASSPHPSSSTYHSTPSNLPHPVPLTPQLSSFLLQVPHTSSSTSIGMVQIHLLRTVHSASYTASHQASSISSAHVPDDQDLLADVTHNFHELAVLAKVGYNLNGVGSHKGLPFHLAAVDAMRMALDRDWDRLEAGADS